MSYLACLCLGALLALAAERYSPYYYSLLKAKLAALLGRYGL